MKPVAESIGPEHHGPLRDSAEIAHNPAERSQIYLFARPFLTVMM